MKPGADLDALVAQKVMGWKWQAIPQHIHIVDGGSQFEKDGKFLMPENSYFPPHEVGQGRLFYQAVAPAYSTSLEAAWKVVEKLQTIYEKFNVEFSCGIYTCRFPNGVVSSEITFPLAVCLGGLGVMERENGASPRP